MIKAILLGALLGAATPVSAQSARATLDTGMVEGIAARDGADVDRYLGIPFAAPPVGPLRWREPQPLVRWSGVRAATAFGPRCMQLPLFADMMFRSPPSSEDCLYLNVWTPPGAAARPGATLPVLLYIYGGGFQTGDASEKRYDGAALAARGAVVVTTNYRLNIFGFLAHPGLTAESPHHASGNYGLLDQAAALAWVRRNISAFGGDPNHITIGGESAGSISVSALMASPLTRDAIVGAIGESGALMGSVTAPPLKAAEQRGVAYAATASAPDVAALRAISAAQLLESVSTATPRFGPVIDGHMLTEPVEATFAAGRQAKVPLLVGTNSQEMGAEAVFDTATPAAANYPAALARLYGDRADQVAALYPIASDADAVPVATALASDRFLSWPTWRWGELHRKAGAPTFIYQFRRVRPRAFVDAPDAKRPWGAVHSAEIEYALGNLDVNPRYAWTAEDRAAAATMTGYWSNFVRTGDPNGAGLPAWPRADGTTPTRQVIDARITTEPFVEQARYQAMHPLIERR